MTTNPTSDRIVFMDETDPHPVDDTGPEPSLSDAALRKAEAEATILRVQAAKATGDFSGSTWADHRAWESDDKTWILEDTYQWAFEAAGDGLSADGVAGILFRIDDIFLEFGQDAVTAARTLRANQPRRVVGESPVTWFRDRCEAIRRERARRAGQAGEPAPLEAGAPADPPSSPAGSRVPVRVPTAWNGACLRAAAAAPSPAPSARRCGTRGTTPC